MDRILTSSLTQSRPTTDCVTDFCVWTRLDLIISRVFSLLSTPHYSSRHSVVWYSRPCLLKFGHFAFPDRIRFFILLPRWSRLLAASCAYSDASSSQLFQISATITSSVCSLHFSPTLLLLYTACYLSCSSLEPPLSSLGLVHDISLHVGPCI